MKSLSSKRLTRCVFGASIAVLSIGLADSARANSETQPDKAKSYESTPSDEAATNENDIIVTAQRREERLVDVPISITSVSDAVLTQTGIQDLKYVMFVTPGLNFQAFGNAAQPIIRGVGSTSSGVGDGSNVPIYVDGVYQPYQGSNYVQLTDVDHIEVLKGPQGTLYGRNAAGGAIVVSTKTPSFTTEGRAAVSYARFNDIEGNLYVSTPIVADKLAINLSGQYIHSDGYRTNLYNGHKIGYNHYHSIRSKVLYEDGPVKILLTGSYQDGNDIRGFGNLPYQGNTAVRRQVPNILLATNPDTYGGNIDPLNKLTQYNGNLKVDLDLGFGTLTSFTSYTDIKQSLAFDSDVTPASFSQSLANIHVRSFMQDLTLVSHLDGPLQFILGGSYYDESDHVSLRSYGGLTTPATPPLTFALEVSPHTRAYAAFGELSYEITDSLKITGGLRYSTEKPYFIANILNTTTLVPGPNVRSNRARYDKLTPRVTIQYKIAPDLSAYASYNQGFKSGVTNPLAVQLAPAAPETINAYEVGLKGATSRTFSFGTAAFYYDYKNLQFQAFGASSLSPILRNAAAAEIYGFEASTTLVPLKGLTLRAGLAYTHGEYTSFTNAQVYRPARDASGNILGGNISTNENVSGNRLVRTPRFQGNGSINYKFELGNGGTIETNFNGSYQSSKNYDVVGAFKQGGYAVFNANVSYALPGDQFKITAFSTNIFNARPLASVQPSALIAGAFYLEPTVYGARVEFKF